MIQFVFTLSPIHSDLLAPLRTVEGLFVAESREVIWVRYASESGKLPLELDIIPWQARFTTDAQRLLYPIRHSVPVQHLPDLSWERTYRTIQVELPVPAFPVQPQGKISLSLIPATRQEQPVVALWTDWDTWSLWVEQAPETRLNRLQYAVSPRKDVLVKGQPLPPIQGIGLWALGRLLLPAGLTLNYPALVPVLEQEWGTSGHDLMILFHEPLQVHCLSPDSFQPARRSSVRATAQKWHE